MKRRHLITLPLAALLPRHLLAQTRDNIAAKKRPDAPYNLYPTQKLAQLPGYSMQQTDPPRNSFGGWNTNRGGRATGKYRTEKQNGRWWLIDPSGNRCLHIAVVSLYNSETPGSRAAYQKNTEALPTGRTKPPTNCGRSASTARAVGAASPKSAPPTAASATAPTSNRWRNSATRSKPKATFRAKWAGKATPTTSFASSPRALMRTSKQKPKNWRNTPMTPTSSATLPTTNCRGKRRA